MRSKMTTLKPVTLAALGILCWCSIGANGAGLEVQRPTALVGYQLTYDGKIMGVTCAEWTITEVEQNGDVVSACGDYRMKFSGANDLNPIRLFNKDGRTLMEFIPYAPTLKFPLDVGHKWSGQYRFVNADLGINANARSSCEVASYEDVTVPAGTLRAFRIVCLDKLEMGSRELRSHTTRWYAPEVAVVVKSAQREDPANWNFELTRYGLAGENPPAAQLPTEAPTVDSIPASPPLMDGDLERIAPVLDPSAY